MWGLSADLLGRASQKTQAEIIFIYTFLHKMCLRWTYFEQKTILLLTKHDSLTCYTWWFTIRVTELFSINVFNLLSVFHQIIFIYMFCIRLELVGITILSYRYMDCVHCATVHKYSFFHLLIKKATLYNMKLLSKTRSTSPAQNCGFVYSCRPGSDIRQCGGQRARMTK